MNGTIRRRGSRSWEIRFDLPRGADGKRRRQGVNVKGTKAEAQHRLRELVTRAEAGVPLATSRTTVSAFLEQWLDSHASRIRERTLYGYRNVLRGYVIPALGDVRLTQLRAASIEALYSSLLKRGLAPRTVLQTHRILKKALKQAVRLGLSSHNPADLVDPPSFEPKEMVTLSGGQLAELLHAVIDTPYGAPIYLAAHTGMRRGELVGLQWPDIGFENAVISIKREVVFVPGSGYLVTPPKSAKSRRAIDITSKVVAELRGHRVAQAEHRLRLGPAWKDGDWVFTQPNGAHLNPNDLTRTFKAVRESLDLPPVRFHDLRHTHASLMLLAGVNLKVVQERLGHASIGITGDTYSHVAPGLQKLAARSFEQALTISGDQPAKASR